MSILQDIFEMSVVISAVDKFTDPMRKMESSMKYSQQNMDLITKSMKNMGASSSEIDKMTAAMNRMSRNKAWANLAEDMKSAGVQQDVIDRYAAGFENLAAQQERLDKLTASFSKFQKVALAGAAITGVGFMMAEGLAKATEQAGQLLTVMTTIQDATGANNSQMASIQDTIMKTSAVTRYGIMDTAGIAQILATSGYDPSQTNQLLPVFTKFAEVQQYGKGAAPDESVKQAIELAHGFGKYSPQDLNTFLNMYNKGTFLQPEDSAKFGETLKYLMNTAGTLGMSNTDTVYMAALANRMGLAGSMGGTNAADMLMRSIPGISGGLTPNKDGTLPKALAAMVSLGLSDKKGNSKFFDKNGKIVDLADFMDTLYTATKGMSDEKKYQEFHDIFGIQGNRVAQLFASKQGQDQLSALHAGMNRVQSIDKMQEDYLNTPEGQINQLKSNLDNLKFSAFVALAKTMNPLLKDMNDFVQKIITFADEHPKIAQYAATFALITTGLLLVAGPLTSFIGLIGMARNAMLLFDAAADANPVGIVVLAIAALIAIGVELYMHWDQLTQITDDLWEKYKNNPILSFMIGPIVRFVDTVDMLKNHWQDAGSILSDVWGDIKNDFTSGADVIINSINQMITGLNSMNDATHHVSGIADIPLIPTIGGVTATSVSLQNQGMTDNMARRVFAADGSHANGLDRVPFNGYRAILHQDEAVLTASEARQWRGGGRATINIYPLPHQSPTEIGQAAARALGVQARTSVRNRGIRVNRSSF